jgi:hypothetical protein
MVDRVQTLREHRALPRYAVHGTMHIYSSPKCGCPMENGVPMAPVHSLGCPRAREAREKWFPQPSYADAVLWGCDDRMALTMSQRDEAIRELTFLSVAKPETYLRV